MEPDTIIRTLSLIGLVICLVVGSISIRKHVAFRWWVYREAIRRSRKREWEAYVDYYNGTEGPERWERLLHITELIRRRRDLERWNQWVPEDKIVRRRAAVSHPVEVVSTDECAKTESEIALDIKRWLTDNTREETPRSVILEMLNDYSIIQGRGSIDA